MAAKSLEDLLKTSDPLDEGAIAALDAREENGFVDYKLKFEKEDREWLEITKDIIAFANTEGGYLVFGVKDGSFEQIGVDDEVVRTLSDTNNLMQKFNRYVEPPFTAIQTKAIERGGKRFVVLLIPRSTNTHVISKDGSFNQPSGTPRTVLRQGTFYVRRSGANHLGDARDLDAIVDRRIERFRAKLLENITRVVESPIETEVFVVKQEHDGRGTEKKFVIENAPDAIAVKGMTFSVAPETLEQEVAAWIAMNKANPSDVPSARALWKWYAARAQLQVATDQRMRLVLFGLLSCVPVFYWLRGGTADDIKSVLIEVLQRRDGEAEAKSNAMAISAFFGKRFHSAQLARLGAAAKGFGRAAQFPSGDPRSYFVSTLRGKGSRTELEARLDQIARSTLETRDGRPDRAEGWHAERLDCYLYGQSEYGEKSSTSTPESV
jgi:hypothetical protein